MSRGVARSRSKGAVPLARRGNAALGSPAQRKAAAKDEGPGRPMTLRSSRPWESESRRASLGNELEQCVGLEPVFARTRHALFVIHRLQRRYEDRWSNSLESTFRRLFSMLQ